MIALLPAVFFVVSCASPGPQYDWQDLAFMHRPHKKVFVAAAFSDSGARKLVEDEFVGRLKGGGNDAVAGLRNTAPDVVVSYDALTASIREQNADAVLIVRSLGPAEASAASKTGDEDTPPALTDAWSEYHLKGYSAMPLYTWKAERYLLEAVLYDAESGRPLWRSVSELMVNGPLAKDLGPFVSAALGRMRADGMIK